MTPLENLTRWNDYFENRRLYSNEERRMIRVQLRKEDEQEEIKTFPFTKRLKVQTFPYGMNISKAGNCIRQRKK